MFSVLYVDDEESLLEITRLFLGRDGEFEVDTAVSAQEGLEKLERKRYDAIISDYHMPGMNGITFLKEVRSRFGTLPFILFTGRGREEVVIEAINNGADFYLQKGGEPRAQFAELAHKLRIAVQRIRSEEALKNSEQRLSDIIDFLPDATFVIDRSGSTIAWNHSIEEMTGIPAADMIGKGDYEYAIPFYGTRRKILIDLIFEDDETLERDYAHIIHDRGTLIAETSLPRPKGKPVILLGKASPLYNRQGELVGAIESIRDITDRKAEEIALQKSEERLRFALEGANDGLWDVNMATGEVYVSPRGCEILGYTPEELPKLIRIWNDLVYEKDLPATQAALNDYLAGKTPVFRIEQRLRTKSGELKWILTRGKVASRDQNGQPLRMTGTHTDITDRKQAEDELRAMNEQLAATEEELRAQYDTLALNQKELAVSEEKYRTILENIQDIYYRTDDKGNMVMWSPSAVSLLGYTAEEIAGRDAADFYKNPKEREKFLAALKKDGSVSNMEVELKRKDGNTLIVSTSSHRYFDADGKYAGVEGIFRDITPFKRVQQELRQSEEQYRILVEHSLDGTFLGQDGILLLCNDAFARIAGYVPAEIIGRPFIDLVAPEDREMVFTREHGRLAGESVPASYDFRMLHKDGSTRVPVILSIGVGPYRDRPAVMGTIRDLTVEQTREHALLESEERFRTLADDMPGFVCSFLPDGTLTYVNSALAATTGMRPGEMVGRGFFEFVDPQVRGIVSGNLAGLTPEKPIVVHEQSVRTSDGRKIFQEWRNRAIFDDRGKVSHYLAIGIDITDRKAAERELREDEARLELLLEVSQMGTWDLDLVHHSARRSLRHDQIFGYESLLPEWTYEMFLDHVLPEDRNDVDNKFQYAIANHRSWSFECRIRRRDGILRWIMARGRGEYDEAGNPVRMIGIVQDITERKELMKALQESETQYRNLVDNIQDIVWQTTTDLRFTFVSQAVQRITGLVPEEVLGRSLFDLITPGSRECVKGRLMARLAEAKAGTTKSTVFEIEMAAKDRRMIWLEVSSSPLYTKPGGELAGFQGITRDITERKRAEEALRLANHKLNLLSSVTRHDVLNQLMALRAYNDLSKKFSTDEKFRDYTGKEDQIIAKIERQILFTREYQDIGIQAPAWQEVKSAITLAGKGLDLSRIEVQFAGLQDVEILADPMLQKVFFNLLDNSLRHGGENLRGVHFFSHLSKNALVIVCEDDGVGIGAGEKEKIFDRGYGKNTGFGLFLIREILAITGITIKETSGPGEGARFEISVPPGLYRFPEKTTACKS